jgi:hypothetical protein
MYEFKTPERILFGAQIKQLFENNDYKWELIATEWRVWESYGIISRMFLKTKNKKNLVKKYRR